MSDPFMWGLYLRLGPLFDPVDPTNEHGRYLGESVEIDWERAERRVKELAKTGFDTVLLEIGEAMAFECLPKAHLKGQATPAEVNAHIRAWKDRYGITTYPIIELSAPRCDWMGEYSRMVGTPPYRRKAREALIEAYEVLEKPKYIHIGMADETRRDANKMVTIYRQKDVLWHDLKVFADDLVRLGARPWMWGDVVWSHPTEFAEKLSKDYLVSYRWMVNVMTGNVIPKGEEEWIRTFDALEAAGFDQVPTFSTSGWYQRGRARSLETNLNAPYCANYVREHVSSAHLKGLCCFSHFLPNEIGDRVQMQTCWVLKKVKDSWPGL